MHDGDGMARSCVIHSITFTCTVPLTRYVGQHVFRAAGSRQMERDTLVTLSDEICSKLVSGKIFTL